MIRFEPGVPESERSAVLSALVALRERSERPGVEVRSERLLRCVARVELPGGRAAYLKLHRMPRGRDRTRYLFRPLPSVAERRAIHLVSRAGILCPEPLGLGGARALLVPREAWLATYEVAGAAAGADALAQALDLARSLADAGLLHPDLHPGNLLACPDGRLFLLDLQSVRPALDRGATLASMQARCCLGFAILARSNVEFVVEEGVRLGRIARAASRDAVAAALRIHGRWLLSRARRNLVESTGFTVSGLFARRASVRGFVPPAPCDRAQGARAVAGLSCRAVQTSSAELVVVEGPPRLADAWTGDLWRALTTGEPPRLLACERMLLTRKTRLYVRASNDEWPEILEKDLAFCSDLRRFERELRKTEHPSPLVTPLLGAGYNPGPSAPINPRTGNGASWRTR